MSEPQSEANPSTADADQTSVVPAQYLFPFILVTTLFALWGFANNYTDPLVRAFKEIFLISNLESSLVQFAFYGGYATMAIPAALIIRKLSFKAGIIIGLLLYAAGALLTIPAAMYTAFWLFLVSFYILTFGLAFLETSANPYILTMGPAETATRRLNLAQAFNPVGTLAGGLIASQLILPSLDIDAFRKAELEAHPEYNEMLPSDVDGEINNAMVAFRDNDPVGHQKMQDHDLGVVRLPYVVIALVVLGVMLTFVFSKMPDTGHKEEPIHLAEVLSNLSTFRYIGGVVAQAVYVGAQIMCWTFTIHYGMILLRMDAAEAQRYNIAATVIFLVSRFVWTLVLKYLSPGMLLGCLAVAGVALCAGTVFLEGIVGMYCLVSISACMGVMFPTIYGIALDGLSVDDAKLGSAGLIFAIVGGAILPLIAGGVVDYKTVSLGPLEIEGIRAAYLLPLVSFVIVAIYGFLTAKPRAAAVA